MLVDSAIVVTEYADRLIEKGVEPRSAYGSGAKRMSWPIIASTVTTLVVFMPLLFWPGIVGQFMKYMPITLIATLSASLLMAMIFLPTIGTRLSRWMQESRWLSRLDSGRQEFTELSERYVRLLEKVLQRPWRFIGGLSGGVVCVIMLFVMAGPGVEFFPKIEPDNVNLLLRAQGNLSMQEKDELLAQVESRLADLDEEVRIFYGQAGKLSLRNIPEDTIGVVQMELHHWRKRRKADEVLAEMVRRTQDIPGIIVETAKQQEGPPTGKAVQPEFRSRQGELLEPEVTRFVTQAMPAIGGFINIEDERPVPQIEWEYEVNREKAGKNNISMRDVGNVVKLVSRGIKIDEYRPDDADDEIDIIVRFPKEDRTLDKIEQLRVYTPDGLVPVSNFLSRVAKQNVGTIRRVDGQRVIKCTCGSGAGLTGR